MQEHGGPALSTTVPLTFCLVTKRALQDEVLGGFLQHDACQSLFCLSFREASFSLTAQGMANRGSGYSVK